MCSVQNILRLLGEIIADQHCDEEKHPAELYDTHPVSLMLVADADIIKYPNLIKITNTWKPEWIKNGIQVPTRDLSLLPSASVQKAKLPVVKRKSASYPLPEKLIRCTRDEFYDPNLHHVSKKGTSALVCYHFDDMDTTWLAIVNEERECLGGNRIQEWMLENVMEAAEEICYIKRRTASAIEAESVNNPEFDANARCDICQSYDGEDGNELVFCDGCFVCVHQACYGVPHLPEGSWLCRRCEMGAKSTTQCVLCPNTGGAMKLVDDYKSWCHVSCALWVPEVGFGDIELMEPVTKLQEVPQARKHLLCSLCKVHCGAPIQCSVKKCKVAFHVTCAFQKNLVMLQELVGSDVRLLAHCPKHSNKEYQARLALLRTPKKGAVNTATATTSANGAVQYIDQNAPTHAVDSPKKAELSQKTLSGSPIKSPQSDDPKAAGILAVTVEDVINLLEVRSQRSSTKRKSPTKQQQSPEDVIPLDVVNLLLTYWRMKRRSNFNRPLVDVPERWMHSSLPTKTPSDEAMLKAETTAELVNRCKHIRFSLDRARLVADMVLTREKRKSALHRNMANIADLQLTLLLQNPDLVSSNDVFSSAHIGSSVYDNYATLEAAVGPLDKGSPPEKLQRRRRKKIKTEQVTELEESKPTSGYIVTGNPIVDALFPSQMIVSDSVRKRLQMALSKRYTKRRKRLISAEQTIITDAPAHYNRWIHDSHLPHAVSSQIYVTDGQAILSQVEPLAVVPMKRSSGHWKQQKLRGWFGSGEPKSQTPRRALQTVENTGSSPNISPGSPPAKRAKFEGKQHVIDVIS